MTHLNVPLTDRLDAIGDDIDMAERSPEMARHLALDHGPQMLSSLRAVLDLHKPTDWGDGHVTCGSCWNPERDGLRLYPCPTVKIVVGAFDEVIA